MVLLTHVALHDARSIVRVYVDEYEGSLEQPTMYEVVLRLDVLMQLKSI